jgi:hypothetical protein
MGDLKYVGMSILRSTFAIFLDDICAVSTLFMWKDTTYEMK